LDPNPSSLLSPRSPPTPINVEDSGSQALSSDHDSEDDPELLNRVHSSSENRSRAPSRNSQAESRSDEHNFSLEETNASGRTPFPIHDEKREEGGNAGSDSQRDERREANSQDPTQNEIRRLRA
jgi:hypothetical protein